MATYTKLALSGSTNGKPIKITASGTLGTTIHTAVSGTSDFDEVWLYAYNGHTSDVVLTVEFGGVSVPDENIVTTLPSKLGLVPIVPGLILQNGLVISAFSDTPNVVTLAGFINRIGA